MRGHILRQRVVLACIALLSSTGLSASPSGPFVIPGPGTVPGGVPAIPAAGQTPPQQVTGELVGFICPPQTLLGSNLQDRCNEIAVEILGLPGSTGDTSGALAGLQAMATEENSAVQTIEVDAKGANTEEVRERLEQRREEDEEDEDEGSAFNISVDGRRITAAEFFGLPSGGGASADSIGGGRWGVFVNGNFGIGDKDSTPNETGFDLDSYGVTGGVDYRLTDQSLIGVAVGYSTSDADLDANSGKVETDGISVSFYGSYYPSPQSYINAIVSYSNNDIDQERNVIYTINSFLGLSVVNQTAFSDSGSDVIAGSLEAGYDFYYTNIVVTPYARVDIAHTEIDGYTETLSTPAPGTVGSGFALQIFDQDFTSATLAVGGRIATAFETGTAVLYPQVGAEAVSEFENESESTTGRLVDDRSGSIFLLPTDDADRIYGNVSAGVTADFRNGLYGHILYQGLLGYEDLNVHAFEIGARLQF